MFIAVGLAGCDASGRFGEFGGARQAVAPPPPPPPRAQTFTPVPTGRVDSTPLPPPGGGANPNLGELPPPAPGGVANAPGLPPIGSTVPIDPEPPIVARPRPASPPVNDPVPAAPPPQVAARPEPTPQSSGAPTRTSVTGNWRAKEASGANCRLTLSSTPTLDLYKASSSGCQSRELQRVSAWELRGDEVYLYEQGGGVAARLKQSGGNFEGSAAKTGAPITLSK